jgi:hypothetical protein
VDPVLVNETLVQTAPLPSTSLTEPDGPQAHGILAIDIEMGCPRRPVERTKVQAAALARDSQESFRGIEHVSQGDSKTASPPLEQALMSKERERERDNPTGAPMRSAAYQRTPRLADVGCVVNLGRAR